MLEELLNELSASGWTVSWAFQFAPNHWRVSIMKPVEDGDLLSHCADAPSFREALEDAMAGIANAEFVEEHERTYEIDKSKPMSLARALGISKPIERRF